MVIPTANLKKQVNTPNASIGKVDDPSESIKQSFQPAISLVQKIASIGDPILKFQVAQKKAEEDKKANDAFTTLVDKGNELMDSFSQVKKDGAEKFYDKTFKTKIEEFDTDFLKVINNIEDADIRESTRRQANQFKLSLRGQANTHRFNEKMSSVKDSSDNKISVLGQEAIKNTTANAKDNMVILAHASNQIIGEIAKKEAYLSSADKSEKSEQFKEAEKSLKASSAVRLEAQTHVNKVVGSIYNSMVGQSRNMTFGQKYAEPKAFLKQAYEGGYIDAATYQTYLHKAAQEELATEVKTNPGYFIKDGVVDQSLIDSLSGDMLSPWERTQLIESVETELNGKGPLSEEGKLKLEEEEYAQSALIEQELAKAGLYSKEYYTTLQVAQGKKPQDMAEIKHAHYKNVDPIAVFKLYDLLDAQGSRLVNIEGKNRRVVTKEYRDAREAALDYIQYFVENYDDELVSQSRRTGIPGFIERTVRSTVFPGRNFTADEAGLHKIIGNFRVDLNKGLGELGPKTANNYYDVANAYVKYSRSLKKAGIDSTKAIEGNYDDVASQQKIMAAYADAVYENNMAINSVADETFVEGVMTNNFTPKDWAIVKEASDFFGSDTGITGITWRETFDRFVSAGTMGPMVAPTLLGQKLYENKKSKKREKDRIEYVARQIEMKQKAEEEYNKKMIEEQKKRQKLIEDAKKGAKK